MKISVILHEKGSNLLSYYMEENNIKSEAETIRKCIKFVVKIESRGNMLFDINNKLRKYSEKIIRTILCQYGI